VGISGHFSINPLAAAGIPPCIPWHADLILREGT